MSYSKAQSGVLHVARNTFFSPIVEHRPPSAHINSPVDTLPCIRSCQPRPLYRQYLRRRLAAFEKFLSNFVPKVQPTPAIGIRVEDFG